MNAYERVAGIMSDIVFSTFQTEVVVRRKGKTSAVVDGIFDEAHKTVDVSTGVPVSTVHPQVEFQSGKLPWPVRQGDILEIRGARYEVMDVQPDGFGHVVVPLHRKEGA